MRNVSLQFRQCCCCGPTWKDVDLPSGFRCLKAQAKFDRLDRRAGALATTFVGAGIKRRPFQLSKASAGQRVIGTEDYWRR